jgi:hypothetical protein
VITPSLVLRPKNNLMKQSNLSKPDSYLSLQLYPLQ